MELRQACITCCPAIVAYAEGLWAGDLVEQLCTLLIKHLDDTSPAVRLAAAQALGESCVLAMSHPFNASAKGKTSKVAAKHKVQLNKMFETKKTEPTCVIAPEAPKPCSNFRPTCLLIPCDSRDVWSAARRWKRWLGYS